MKHRTFTQTPGRLPIPWHELGEQITRLEDVLEHRSPVAVGGASSSAESY